MDCCASRGTKVKGRGEAALRAQFKKGAHAKTAAGAIGVVLTDAHEADVHISGEFGWQWDHTIKDCFSWLSM